MQGEGGGGVWWELAVCCEPVITSQLEAGINTSFVADSQKQS